MWFTNHIRLGLAQFQPRSQSTLERTEAVILETLLSRTWFSAYHRQSPEQQSEKSKTL
jgi:hypothetical protein